MRLDLYLVTVDVAHLLPVVALYVLGCLALVVVLNWWAGRELARDLEDREVAELESWLELR